MGCGNDLGHVIWGIGYGQNMYMGICNNKRNKHDKHYDIDIIIFEKL